MKSLKSANLAFATSPLILITAVVTLGVPASKAQSAMSNPTRVYGVFVGTSPADEPVRKVLQIPSGAEPEVIEWKLVLHQDSKTLAPTRYELRCDYGLTASGEPGLARQRNSLRREGVWVRSKGSKSNPSATVIELQSALSLVQIDENVLHMLNFDRSLLAGNGGWSYSLNRAERAEESVDPALARSGPDMSYKIAPLAAGPEVFGVFEGRSPCQGIASQLRIPVSAGCMKAKWRVTLYQNSETLAPTKYRVEGTLFRRGALEGDWARLAGDSGQPVYRLTAGGKQPSLHLLQADENVLFFLDQNQQPMVGNLDFSYTLDRRTRSRVTSLR